jgi:hypothetical protein
MIDASALQMLLMVLTGWPERREREALAYLIEENRVLRRQLGGRRLRLGGLWPFVRSSPTTRRAAFFLAALSVALCVFGSGRAVVVFRSNAADSAEVTRLYAWMGLPLALAIVGMVTTLSERIDPALVERRRVVWFRCGRRLESRTLLPVMDLGLYRPVARQYGGARAGQGRTRATPRRLR